MSDESSQVSPRNDHKENPFNQGYDEYDLSTEAANLSESAEHSRLSFESSLASPSSHRAQVPTESSRISSPLRETIEESSPPQRPPLRSPLSMPPSSSDFGLDHNAWADEEDPEFGKEQEVKLTF